MLRIYFYTIIFLLGTTIIVVAQNTESEQPNEWELLSTEVQTRFGKVRFGEIPDTIEFDHPRFYNDFKMGRFNSWLAPKPDALNFRLRSIPEQQSQQSTPSSNILSTDKTNKRIVSANTPVLADTSANSTSQPIQRLPGFFERDGIMDSTVLPEKSLIRSSTGSRWFRDLDRNDRSGLPGLSQQPQPNSGENDHFGGNAITVGGELLQNRQTSQQISQSPISATETTIRTNPIDRQSAARNQAEARRHFEQKLEGMLLSHPSIHFLSPVQVSFQNGIVSVRGIVPDKDHKIAAGNLLLTDPAVKQVNNLISVVPADPAQIVTPIEPK
ncbi:MAG: BON domain-containing protein [Planctomycetaceae bacterium]|jgi:hypothetical protein|nr:BON domain-containing protein [Planctomycetaceae bacterium]